MEDDIQKTTFVKIAAENTFYEHRKCYCKYL